MKITRVTLYVVNVPERHWWWSDDVYGQPYHQRADHGIAEVETDEGLTGLTQIGRFTSTDTIDENLNDWLGVDVLSVNLAEPRQEMIGAFEQTILDIRGQALGVPTADFLCEAKHTYLIY